MNFTTIEQSKHLLKLGLKPKTADMYYTFNFKPISEPRIGVGGYADIPCWSVGALIDVLPKHIKNDDVFYKLKIIQTGLFSHWKILYSARVPFKLEKRTVLTNKAIIESNEKDILVDALIEIILLCLENGYIEKKGE